MAAVRTGCGVASRTPSRDVGRRLSGVRNRLGRCPRRCSSRSRYCRRIAAVPRCGRRCCQGSSGVGTGCIAGILGTAAGASSWVRGPSTAGWPAGDLSEGVRRRVVGRPKFRGSATSIEDKCGDGLGRGCRRSSVERRSDRRTDSLAETVREKQVGGTERQRGARREAGETAQRQHAGDEGVGRALCRQGERAGYRRHARGSLPV